MVLVGLSGSAKINRSVAYFPILESPLMLQAPSYACQTSIPGFSGNPSINLFASVASHAQPNKSAT